MVFIDKIDVILLFLAFNMILSILFAIASFKFFRFDTFAGSSNMNDIQINDINPMTADKIAALNNDTSALK